MTFIIFHAVLSVYLCTDFYIIRNYKREKDKFNNEKYEI